MIDERFSFVVPEWGPAIDSPFYQRRSYNVERVDWEGESEAYMDQGQEVSSGVNIMYGTVFRDNYVQPFDQAGIHFRDFERRKHLEESVLLPEADQPPEHNRFWCTDLPVPQEHLSACRGLTFNDLRNRQFFQDIPHDSNAFHLPDSIEDNFSDIRSPKSTEDALSDEFSEYYYPSYFSTHSPRPNTADCQHENHMREEWQVLNLAAMSLRRQRRRLRYRLRVLYRSQRALEIEQRTFRHLRDDDMREPERDRRWYLNRGNFGEENNDDMWNRDKRHFWGFQRSRTEQSHEENSYHSGSENFNDPDTPLGHDWRDNSEYERYTDHHGQRSSPPLTADAINEAKNNLADYESAWSSISQQNQGCSAAIPYPTVTLKSKLLLEPFPSYIRLPRNLGHHPSTHMRIQFHTLEFYLHPLGLQPSLTFTSTIETVNEPEQIPDADLGIIGLETLDAIRLEDLKRAMFKEVEKWHEDKIRLKGFGEVLDCEAVTHQCPYSDNRYGKGVEYVTGKTVEMDEKLLGRDIVQGIWAAVQVLRGLVSAELQRRKNDPGHEGIRSI